MRIAVVGHTGTVGRCVYDWYWRHGERMSGYSLDAPVWDWQGADWVFICVPTPDGPEIVRECVGRIVGRPVVIIKSTVPPGTCDALAAEFPHLTILHNPEFLSAATALGDFNAPVRQIVGGEDTFLCRRVLATLPIGDREIICTRAQAETLKYMHNTFGALMVVYCNLFADVCAQAGADWEDTRAMAASEWLPRETLERYGTIWHDGKRGFGGACFPKDTRALLAHCQAHGIGAELLEGLLRHNERLLTEATETWTKGHGS